MAYLPWRFMAMTFSLTLSAAYLYAPIVKGKTIQLPYAIVLPQKRKKCAVPIAS